MKTHATQRGRGYRQRFIGMALAALWMSCGQDTVRGEPSGRAQESTTDAGATEPVDAAADAVDLAGTWLGTLDLPPVPIRIVFNVTRGPSGAWTGTADNPDQGGFGIPITRIDVTAPRSWSVWIISLSSSRESYRGMARRWPERWCRAGPYSR